MNVGVRELFISDGFICFVVSVSWKSRRQTDNGFSILFVVVAVLALQARKKRVKAKKTNKK